jgi:hypothetical protein
VNSNVPETLRAKCLKQMQLLRRLEEATDEGYCTCVSCGSVGHWTEMHGGHWIPKGRSSYFALNPKNIWPQCPACNLFGMKHGVAAHNYTLFMTGKFGKKAVKKMLSETKKTVKIYAKDYRDMLQDLDGRIKEEKRRLL